MSNVYLYPFFIGSPFKSGMLFYKVKQKISKYNFGYMVVGFNCYVNLYMKTVTEVETLTNFT